MGRVAVASLSAAGGEFGDSERRWRRHSVSPICLATVLVADMQPLLLLISACGGRGRLTRTHTVDQFRGFATLSVRQIRGRPADDYYHQFSELFCPFFLLRFASFWGRLRAPVFVVYFFAVSE